MASNAPITGARTRAPIPDILDLRMGAMTPFLSGGDLANDAIRGAHALLMVMAGAWQDSRVITAKCLGEESSIDTLNPAIVADALEAVSTLLALAQHGIDRAAAERRI